MRITEAIRKARQYGLELTTNDFVDGTLDGMEPEEWLKDMTMD